VPKKIELPFDPDARGQNPIIASLIDQFRRSILHEKNFIRIGSSTDNNFSKDKQRESKINKKNIFQIVFSFKK